SPRSVAVLGASTTKGKVGYDIFANIIKGGFTGTLYPVNPTANAILSNKAYKSILAIPEPVDLAIVILPPKLALPAIAEVIEKGVKGVVIVSAGFREVGGEGREIEDRIVAQCREAGVRLVGPNCLGVINPIEGVRLNASFSKRMPQPGNISFISQSGALCTSVLDFAADRDFGFSKFISIGNKADVDELDLLRYLHEDFDTDVIMMYLEELRRGREFIDEVKEITSGSRPTPILAIKSGRTSAGAQAAASHTGALAGSEAIYDAIFKQAGIIRCNTIDELFDFASAFAFKKRSLLGKHIRKIPGGNRVAIVTNAGGPGIIATDMTMSAGLELARFNPDTIEALASHLPSTANIHNPVDVIGDAPYDRYEKALAAVISDENVDGALVILTPQSMTNALDTAKAIVQIAQRSNKPILCCFMGVVDVSQGVKYLQEYGYPVYRFPENAANAFAALYRFSRWVNRQHMAPLVISHDKAKAEQIIQACLAAGKTKLGELEGNELLACYSFPVLPTRLSTSEEEAAAAAREIGLPVVLKIVSPQILHKSDAGGVAVGLKTEDEVRDAYRRIMASAAQYDPKAEITGVLVVKHAPAGEEIILGANRYPVFGPLLMFGLGGIFVEVFKDVEFRLAPINRNEGRRMIRSIKGYKILQGYRGKPAVDLAALERLLVCLSDLMMNHPQIKEIDINPLLAHAEGQGATVADCRIILEEADEA
ncbi:MAG TPA: acetate--CoA ligase family protein, partial [Deltaproteobacteria bacterium]|nr:acetate--CoA ligase family protein [Deltaproteobacteria bacterium]